MDTLLHSLTSLPDIPAALERAQQDERSLLAKVVPLDMMCSHLLSRCAAVGGNKVCNQRSRRSLC